MSSFFFLFPSFPSSLYPARQNNNTTANSHPLQPSCGAFHCAAGSYCPTEAYFVDQPKIKLGIDEPVKTCPGAGTALDLQVTLCADNPGNDGGLALQGRSVAGRRLMI
jgi:hypothetical protein